MLIYSADVDQRTFTVSEAAGLIRQALELPELQGLCVTGEVAGVRNDARGHLYFSLRDAESSLSAVIWAGQQHVQRRFVSEGRLLTCKCRVDFYEKRGTLSLIVQNVSPVGEGQLAARLQELKRKLEAEGLFDGERKRPIPPYCRHLAVVTSRDGAVLQDILRVTLERAPWVRISVYPSAVQGAAAVESLLKALAQAGRARDIDALIVARGGGSLEDLWCFNDERLARVVGAFPVPVVTAIGHETDTTLVDYASDCRAATPTQAAVLCTPDGEALLTQIETAMNRLHRCRRARIEDAGKRLQMLDRLPARIEQLMDARWEATERAGVELRRSGQAVLETRQSALDTNARILMAHRPDREFSRRRFELLGLGKLLGNSAAACMREFRRNLSASSVSLWTRSPSARLMREGARLEERARTLCAGKENRLNAAGTQLHTLCEQVRLLGPFNVLERGYALVQRPDGSLVKRAGGVAAGDAISIRMADGRIGATATEVEDGKAGAGTADV